MLDSFDEESLRRFCFLVPSNSADTKEEDDIKLLPAEKGKIVKIDKHYHSSDSTSSANFDASSIFLRRTWDLSQLSKLVSTWSGVLDWNQRNEGRDLLSEFEQRMIEEGGWGEEGREKVELVWSIGGMGGRKEGGPCEIAT